MPLSLKQEIFWHKSVSLAKEAKMSMVKWDPLRDIEELLGRSDRRSGLTVTMGVDLLSKGDWTPRIDITETDKSFVIKMEIPDVEKKDF
jgi:HSP20 family protein